MTKGERERKKEAAQTKELMNREGKKELLKSGIEREREN